MRREAKRADTSKNDESRLYHPNSRVFFFFVCVVLFLAPSLIILEIESSIFLWRVFSALGAGNRIGTQQLVFFVDLVRVQLRWPFRAFLKFSFFKFTRKKLFFLFPVCVTRLIPDQLACLKGD